MYCFFYIHFIKGFYTCDIFDIFCQNNQFFDIQSFYDIAIEKIALVSPRYVNSKVPNRNGETDTLFYFRCKKLLRVDGNII